MMKILGGCVSLLIGIAAIAADPGTEPKKVAESNRSVASGATSSAKAVDRLDLDASQVTGNSELPKIMVIVPWKHADVGNVAGRPVNSLMDEVLKPLDRDVLRRETEYYTKIGSQPAESPSKPEN
jgi:hypothetical protein